MAALAAMAVAVAGMTFAYTVLLRIPSGFPRLTAAIPWMVALWGLPWDIPTVHLRALVAFFFTWMISFKLLLLCFDLGPGVDPDVTKSFPKFFAAMALSFNIPRKNSIPGDASQLEPWPRVILRALFKSCLVALFFKTVYKNRHDPDMPIAILYMAFSLHIYLACSAIFESMAAVASATIGIRLEPQFDSPFLSSSMADFWGRRWNILASSALRALIYDPILQLMLGNIPSKAAPLFPRSVATMAVFLVSGLMHELIFFYMNKSRPTWEVTAFFVINGMASVIEYSLKRFNRGRFKIPRPVAIVITLAFIFSTACWFFFPPIHRTGTCFQALDEFETVLGLIQSRFLS